MKKILSYILLFCLCPSLCFAMTKEEFIEFTTHAYEPDTVIQTCNDALANHVKGDASYESTVYAARAHAYSRKELWRDAIKDAEMSISILPESSAYGTLIDASIAIGDYANAADALEKAMSSTKSIDHDSQKHIIHCVQELRLMADGLTAAQLWKIFNEEQNFANQFFREKMLIVDGKVTELNLDLYSPEIVFHIDTPGTHTVTCRLDTNQTGTAATLKPGQDITVGGVCDGMHDNDVVLKKCYFL